MCLAGSPHGCSQPSARLACAGSPAEVTTTRGTILCHVGSQSPSSGISARRRIFLPLLAARLQLWWRSGIPQDCSSLALSALVI